MNTDLFIELLEPNYSDAVNYCNALCSSRNPDDAKDLLQQSLLRCMEKLDTLQDKAKFRSWFFTIITRLFYSSRRNSFWKRFLAADNVKDFENIPGDSHSSVIDLKLELNGALSKLSSKERSALLLFELGNFSIDEIANIQNGRGVSAVKSRLSRARKKLRTILTESENNTETKLNNKPQNFSGDIENETIRLSAGFGAKK